jgi:ATP-dependent helicase IRC3
MGITLRPYQQDCINDVLNAWEAGIQRQVVSLPVGAGKTVIFSELIKRIANTFGHKTLVVAHRAELLEQAHEHILLHNPDLRVSHECAEQYADEDCDVIVGSVQSLSANECKRLQRFDPKDFKCLVIDEAHHAAAESYKSIIEFFTNSNVDMLVFGCSATVLRNDHRGLNDVFDDITYHLGMQELMDLGYLCKIENIGVHTEEKLDEVKDKHKLSLAVNTEGRNQLVVENWSKLSKEWRCKSTLVFAVDTEHAAALRAMFVAHGVDARLVTGMTPKPTRKKIVSEFKEQLFPVLVNCEMFMEGTNIPNIDCIVMARPTDSKIFYTQMIGRGVRLFSGKEHCLVIDFMDGDQRGLSLMTFPSLEPKPKNEGVGNRGPSGQVLVDDIDKKQLNTFSLKKNPFRLPSKIDWINITGGLYIAVTEGTIFVLIPLKEGIRYTHTYSITVWQKQEASPRTCGRSLRT